jgi:hypothetical protein
MILYEYNIENTYHSTDDITKIPEGVEYTSREYVEPVEGTDTEVPQEVALWKIRVILKVMGLEQSISNAFELLEEPNKTAAKYIFDYGTAIERYSPTVLFLQQVLQLTDEQVNSIFITANSIIL